MARADESRPDVLVVGEHPATYFAAALLRAKASLTVRHVTLPRVNAGPSLSTSRGDDRLVLINPAFFELHALLQPLRRKLDCTSVYGLQFLSDDPQTRSEHRSKSGMAVVARYQEIRQALMRIAEEAGAKLQTPDSLQICRPDESGLQAIVDGQTIHARVLILGDQLCEAESRLLGLPETWDREVLHRVSRAQLLPGCTFDLGNRPVIPMSLDLHKTLCSAMLLAHGSVGQICAVQSLFEKHPINPGQLLAHWVSVLRSHGILSEAGGAVPFDSILTEDLPLAGAMAQEGLADRTLLIGPAGGFYSATGEDIYPNCWSALFAVDAIKKALKEPHFQDALQVYRHKWRTTLGDYLRGPQQNLRFLLPLVYRNQVMTTRLCESILLGKSMMR
jgi:hypothetical protein